MFAVEMPLGAGKSIVAAKVAQRWSARGEGVIYLCPSPTALGHARSGIVEKFHRVYRHYRLASTEVLGRVGLLCPREVSFLTPRGLFGSGRSRDDVVPEVDETIDSAFLLVVDEAHHFPTDSTGELVLYGRAGDLVQKFAAAGKKVLSITATHARADERVPIGKGEPDLRVTAQEVIDAGHCPEIFGVQVVVRSTRGAKAVGDYYNLHLEGSEHDHYIDLVARCILQVRERNGAPAAVFVRTKREARDLALRFGQLSGLNGGGLVPMTADTPMAERLALVRAIEQGAAFGYVTCGVGEESLDVLVVGVVHLVRRSRSRVRNVQAVGRGMRTSPGKNGLLVVDYGVMREGIVGGLLGLGLVEVAESLGTTVDRRGLRQGGAVVESTKSRIRESTRVQAVDLEVIEEWIRKGTYSNVKLNIDWSTQPLGQETDSLIASRLGVSVSTVSNERQRLGIPRALNSHNNLGIDWDSQPLGKVSDNELAKVLGVSSTTIARRRENRKNE